MSEQKRFRRAKPILIGIFVFLVILMLVLSSIVTKVANDQLPKLTGTEATLGGSQVNLLAGRVALKDLTIQQPEGFEELGDDPFLTMGELVVNVPLRKAIDRNPMIVRNVHLSDVNLNLISDTNVVYNWTQLGPKAQEEPEAEEVTEIPDEESPAESAAVPPIWVKHVLLENIDLAFQDYDRDWKFNMDDIRFELDDLQITESQVDGPAILKGRVTFKSKRADGQLMLFGKIGVLTPEKPEVVPPVQLALALIGFDLNLVEPFLIPSPAVAKTAFGGSGFDFELFMQVSKGEAPKQQAISGKFELVTDKGQKTKGKLGGTVLEPVLPFTTLFADILGNQFGRAFGTVGNVAQGGLEAGKAVGKTGVAAVKGVGKTVGGLAGGVLKTAKGVVTLDGEEAMGGLKDATVGTAKNAAGTVGDTASTAGKGVKDTAGTMTGGDDVKKWWATLEERQTAFEAEAMDWFEANPFGNLLTGTTELVATANTKEADASAENAVEADTEEKKKKRPSGLK